MQHMYGKFKLVVLTSLQHSFSVALNAIIRLENTAKQNSFLLPLSSVAYELVL